MMLVPPPAAPAAFLGVERSLTGRRWQVRTTDERLALALSQRLGLPEVVGRLLAARGIGLDEAEPFLRPTLREMLPDPAHLLGMEAAVERLVRAVRDGESVCIFGDYDVDGATSAALLRRFLDAVGARVRVYIPDRIKEGYGPNAPALLRLRAEGVGLVITVDCGTAAFDPLAAAAEAGMDVIVVDHHEPAGTALPPAVAVVNPKRLDQDNSHPHLAAVGVAFLLVVALNRALREAGWYATRPAPDLMRWLDLVALGTVCDVVPLVGVNRALVTQGLKVMAGRGNAGLAALADVAGVRERPEAYHVGYILGPRVNAGGRVGEADLGVRLLTTEDAAAAAEMARRLDEYNRERQDIEAAVLLAAIEQVEGREDDGGVVVAAGEGWHPGVIGIVAGRLKERYNRPACVVAFEGDVGKGSGRSLAGFDLGAAVIAAHQDGLLVAGGGHAMAAGFTVEKAKLPAFRAFLDGRLAEHAAGRLVPSLELDGAVDLGGCTVSLVERLRALGPFGAGNAEPRFAVPAARVARADVVGSGHVRCLLNGAGGARLKAMAFRAADSELGHALLNAAGAALHFAGTLRADNWQGREAVQLFIDDAAPAR